MKIVFYSTNSNTFNDKMFKINIFPTNNDVFKDFCGKNTKDQFFVVMQKPGFFLPDGDSLYNSAQVFILSQNSTITDFADKILSLSPDIAIPFTWWVDPFDWLTINDTLVAEQLKAHGVKTIAHSLDTGMTCLNKSKTCEKLKALGFFVPNSVTVEHDMFFCAGSNKKVIHNVYKDYIVAKIKKLTLPLIIKETVGVSSYGATVVHSYGEAICYLNSKRNNSDRIVEEYIKGRQFGCEIYGIPGNYTIMPLVEFSLNQYGITSPKLSVKYGPAEERSKLGSSLLTSTLNLSKLYKMLNTIAEELQFRGVAQIDLIYDVNKNWHVIEINPRLSGMSFTYAAMIGKSLYEMFYKSCVEEKKISFENVKKVLNIKLPVLMLEKIKKIRELRGVEFVHITNNKEAKQEREKGYTEIILTGKNLDEIKNNLTELKKALPEECYAENFTNVDKFLYQ